MHTFRGWIRTGVLAGLVLAGSLLLPSAAEAHWGSPGISINIPLPVIPLPLLPVVVAPPAYYYRPYSYAPAYYYGNGYGYGRGYGYGYRGGHYRHYRRSRW